MEITFQLKQCFDSDTIKKNTFWGVLSESYGISGKKSGLVF